MSEDRQDTGTGWPEPATGEVGPAAPPPAADVTEERVAQAAAGEEPEAAVGEVAAGEVGVGVGEPAPEPWRPSVRGLRRRRVSVAGAVIGGLLVLLGFALVVQLRSNASDNQLSTARSADLVRILSELDARKDRLSQEITSLEGTKQQLEAGSEGRAAALAEATKRAEELGILAGTLPAQGPGMTVRLVPGSQALKAWLILDTVEELRGAGAEAMQISGSSGGPVRVIASTYFTDAGTGLLVDGQTLTAPYVITVIGDPQVMQPALNIAGGVTDTVHQANGTVIVDQGTVRVAATHAASTPRYAQPAS